MNTELKYPRRKKRKIGNKVYMLEPPSDTRSKTMVQIKSKDTSIEKLFENELRKANISFGKPNFVLESTDGNPDFLIPQERIAIFCDGDFWHGFDINNLEIKTNTGFWDAKIKRNIERDKEVNEKLDKQDWFVLRFWEHDILKNPQECIKKVKLHIIKRSNIFFKKQSQHFTFVDLFAGIGGFRIGIEECGGKCIGFSEIDKKAIAVYKKNFIDFQNVSEWNLGDITNINTLPEKVDLIVGGVPCQSWSVAGKMKGFNDPRGKLWFDTIRVIEKNLPKAFIFENVKGLMDPRNRNNLEFLLDEFSGLGYNVKTELINSYDFGVPQNRDRIFIIGTRKDVPLLKDFVFPEILKTYPKLYRFIDDIEGEVNIKKKKLSTDILFGDKIPASRNRFQKKDELNDFFIFCDTRNGHTTIHSWDLIKTTDQEKEICMTILRNRRKNKFGASDGNPLPLETLLLLTPNIEENDLKKLVKKGILRYIENGGYEFVNSKNSSGINGIYRVFMPHSDIFSTLTATGTKDKVALKAINAEGPSEYKDKFIREIIKKNKYRSITSREAGRLQGFTKWFIMHEDEKTAMKQFGNAVSIPVVYHLIKSLCETNIFKQD